MYYEPSPFKCVKLYFELHAELFFIPINLICNMTAFSTVEYETCAFSLLFQNDEIIKQVVTMVCTWRYSFVKTDNNGLHIIRPTTE